MTTESLPRSAVSAVAWSQWAYWASLAGALLSITYIPAGTIRTFVVLTPALTAILCVAVTFWLYEDCDEYLKHHILRAVTRTAVIIAAGTLGWFLLELNGFPRISMLWVNLIAWSVFNLQMLFVIFRSR